MENTKPDRKSVIAELEKALSATNEAGYHAAVVVVDNDRHAACLVGLARMECSYADFISKSFSTLLLMHEVIGEKIPDVMDEVFLQSCDGDKEKAEEAKRIFKECVAETLTEIAIESAEKSGNLSSN